MKRFIRLGLVRGMLGGNPILLFIGFVAGAMKVANRIGGTDEKTLFSHKLQPGEDLIISHRNHKR